MPIALTDDSRKQALASIKRYCSENIEAELSDIEAGLLLDFFLKEVAPSVYNAAVSDAQTYLRDRLVDLEAAVYEPEFAYWPKGASVRRRL
ncbi:MAG: DUF2164 domain-containing protein [Gemmatimonadota bacterium]